MLRAGTVAAAGAAAASTGLAGLFQRSAGGQANPGSSYGPISPKTPVAAERSADSDVTFLSLPEDFRYTVFGVEGTRMSDGNATPRAHDGMAVFRLPGKGIRLVRNHEDRSSPEQACEAGGARARPAYDRTGRGATTTPDIGLTGDGYPLAKGDFVSMAGTIVNCAGGPTPGGRG